jgi:monoamine oxidase
MFVPPTLRRRLLLQLLAASSTSSLLPGCSDETPAPGQTNGTPQDGGTGKSVVVLGGGLAGLCSAYELKKKGYTVLAVLEAQTRTGGRVLTKRDGLKNGQYAELGATRIADSHNFTLGYAEEFNLPLREFDGGKSTYHVKGKGFVHADGDEWPADVFAFKPDEKTKGADSIVLSYEKLDELGDPTLADWPTGKALEYNDLSLVEYLKKNGATDDHILLNKAINGSEIEKDAALYWLMADVVDAKWDKTLAIAGGNDKLPAAFTAALGSIVKYECVVKAIAQDATSVTVTFDEKGAEKKLTADFCVCALPFTILRKIAVTPAFSPEKKKVVDGMVMNTVSRAYVPTKSRFWKAKGVGGLKVARTDLPIERLWDLTNVQDGETGLLVAYMQSDNGAAYAAKPEADRLGFVENEIAKFWPEIKGERDGGFDKIWADDPWVMGAWGYYLPGQMKTDFPAAKKAEGRIFFCGEHTSPWSGWMQGAFESANRVVAEMG